MARFLSDDLLVTSYSKDSHQTCSALERSIAAETQDSIVSECDVYFSEVRICICFDGTMREEEGGDYLNGAVLLSDSR